MVLILIPQRMLMLLTLCGAIVRVHILHTAVHIHAYYFDSCCPYIYICVRWSFLGFLPVILQIIAITKDMQAVKLCTNKILQFLTTGAG